MNNIYWVIPERIICRDAVYFNNFVASIFFVGCRNYIITAGNTTFKIKLYGKGVYYDNEYVGRVELLYYQRAEIFKNYLPYMIYPVRRVYWSAWFLDKVVVKY